MKYIAIEKELIPYRFTIQLAGETFEFEFHYNETYDFFSCHLSRDGERLITGEKLVYNQPLFSSFQCLRTPMVDLVPFDRSGQETRVSWDNLEKEVFLYVREED